MLKAIAGKGFIVTGDLAEQTRLCAQLGSSAPVEPQPPCLVLQEHLALNLATHIRTTALPALLDTTVKVGNNRGGSHKRLTCSPATGCILISPWLMLCSCQFIYRPICFDEDMFQ